MLKKHLLVALILCGLQLTYAQDWNPQDSIKTVDKKKDRIDDFRDNVLPTTGQDLVDETFPNSWPIFGTKARMAIGGYVKLDYIQDFDGGYDRFQYEIQNVPVPGDGRPLQDGYMNMHARESRVNLDMRALTETGMPIRVFFEIDFYNLDRGAFNQTPRLRHVYGVLGRLLVGRTWGTQSDLYAVPSTIDFAAGDALTGSRRAQIRFEDRITDVYKYAVAVEMLEFPGIDPNGQVGKASQILPMVVGNVTKNLKDGGRLFLGASVFQLRWDGEDDNPDDTAIGWGFSFSGRKYLGAKRHYFNWLSSYGQGWGSQIVATVGTQASAVLDPEGNLKTMPAWNLLGGFVFNISPTLVTSINTAWFGIDPSEFRDPNNLKGGGSGHVNLIWSPYKKVNMGAEFMILKRTNVDGNSGTGKRLQFMVKYLF